MAVDYRFFGTNIDVTLVTDAPTGALTFFVTDIQGYDPTDIMNGIDVEVQEYHEADFIQIAMDHSVGLFRVDRRGEVCLVVQGAAAGGFNGRTSFLSIAGIDFSDGSGSFNTRIRQVLTWRVNEVDIMNLPNEFYLIGSSDGNNVVSFRFSDVEAMSDGSSFSANFFPIINGDTWSRTHSKSPIRVTIIPNMCNIFDVTITRVGANATWTIVINEGSEMVFVVTAFPVITFGSSTTVFIGANGRGGVAESFFRGIIRNIIIEVGTAEVVNIVDPSDGTNTGTGADGTPTDVTSISVIV